MSLHAKTMDSPVGDLRLIANDKSLVAVLWPNDNPKRVPLAAIQDGSKHPVLLETTKQLQAYFAGTLQRFTLPLHFSGTPFQQKVWHALTTIPYGETRSYLQIAQQIDNPKAVRAVGAANGKNPISIIVPCHRVIGADGSLTGFAGGLPTKVYLLNNEAKK